VAELGLAEEGNEGRVGGGEVEGIEVETLAPEISWG
jgi:hypothetical protein